MPRLQSFEVKIKTGEHGMAQTPCYVINGFMLPFDTASGSVQPGENFEATGRPDSFPHSLHLTGPEDGTWDLRDIEVTYFPYGEEPYVVRFATLSLDNQSDLNIWQPRPEPVFDV